MQDITAAVRVSSPQSLSAGPGRNSYGQHLCGTAARVLVWHAALALREHEEGGPADVALTDARLEHHLSVRRQHAQGAASVVELKLMLQDCDAHVAIEADHVVIAVNRRGIEPASDHVEAGIDRHAHDERHRRTHTSAVSQMAVR